MKKKIKIIGLIVFSGLALFYFWKMAIIGLGLSPKIEFYERIYTDRMTSISIRYAYEPEGRKAQEIGFEITDPEIVLRLQRAFKMKSVEAYMSGVYGGAIFTSIDENGKMGEWRIRFSFYKDEFCLAYGKSSCRVYLNDSTFYDLVFNLAYENNRALFPECKPSELELL